VVERVYEEGMEESPLKDSSTITLTRRLGMSQPIGDITRSTNQDSDQQAPARYRRLKLAFAVKE